MGNSVGSISAANELVELVRDLVAQELDKRDTVMVYTVSSRNEDTDTYDLYLDTEYRADGSLPTLIRNIPNSTPAVYRPGEHVYVMRVRNQIAQAFIIGGAYRR